MTFHLERGLTTLNTKKRKKRRMTVKRLKEIKKLIEIQKLDDVLKIIWIKIYRAGTDTNMAQGC